MNIFSFFSYKTFLFFFKKIIYIQTTKNVKKQIFMLHFPKIIQLRQTRNKRLINYCEDAAYYNKNQILSIK